MNEVDSTQYTEPVYRRFLEPVELFGRELNTEFQLKLFWGFVLGVILLVAFVYIAWMYYRDSRSVGPAWAGLLGLLRALTYALLAWVFLLRAERTTEVRQLHSKVALLVDTTPSMGTIDDVPTGQPGEKLLSRQEKVLELLADPATAFLPALEANNPVTVHRFGVRLDDDYLLFRNGRNWTRAEWEAPAAEDKAGPKAPLPEPRPLARELWQAFLMPTSHKAEPPAGWSEADKTRYNNLLMLNKKLGEGGLFAGTNLGDSVLGLVNRELSNMVQGIVVFSDGRSTEESSQAFRDLEKRAKDNRIPIFVVAVGDERPQVRLEVNDLRVPDVVPPDEKFRAVAEVTAEGLVPDRDKVDVELEMSHVRKDQKGKEEPLDVSIIGTDPAGKRLRLVLAQKKPLVLKPAAPPVLKGNPPRATVEFPLDAASLAAAVGVDLAAGEHAARKWEIAESAKDGEYRFVARVPRDKRESFTKPYHTSEPAPLHVVRKPLRVLLFASAPTHDYQFLRTLLVRDKDKIETSIHLQLPPGRSERRVGVVQDVDPERLLSNFPTRLESDGKEDRLEALDEYDVVVAFDPDWTRLSDKQLRMIRKWVDNRGGGLIVIGGPINTVELARPRQKEPEGVVYKLTEQALTWLREEENVPAAVVAKLQALRDKGFKSQAELDRALNDVGRSLGKGELELYRGRIETAARVINPVLDLLPVVLSDIRLSDLDRNTAEPWPLTFDSLDEEFLKLDESAADPRAAWKEFFYGPGADKQAEPGAVLRGFYNYYPAEKAKGNALVLARFTDPRARLKDKDGSEQPFLVVRNPANYGRVVWLGWGETRRLRQYREAYFERFWTKLLRYAADARLKQMRVEYKMSEQALTTIRDAKVPQAVVQKLESLKEKEFTSGEFSAELDRLLNAGERELYRRRIEAAAKVSNRIRLEMSRSYVANKFVEVEAKIDLAGGKAMARLPEITLTLPDGVPDKDIPQPIKMQAKADSDGWFTASFQVRSPGNYKLHLKVPDSGDTQSRAFSVKEANPELDNTRPDFEQLYRLASDATDVLARIANDRDRQEVKQVLEQHAPAGVGDVKPRLYFNLQTARLIPKCMREQTNRENIRGPIQDQWDKGVTLWKRPEPKEPVQFPYVLMAVVGLLSTEWLIRKLLRLA
jgi:hypothetical protein